MRKEYKYRTNLSYLFTYNYKKINKRLILRSQE